MSKPQASKDSYRQEATTRVFTYAAVAIISAIIAAIAAWLIILPFPNVNHETRVNIFGYSLLIVFGLICGIGVYKVDKRLNRRFNQNP